MPRKIYKKIFKKCLTCRKKYKIKHYFIKTSKFCSKECHRIYQIGKPSPMKGRKFPQGYYHKNRGGIKKETNGYILIKDWKHPFHNCQGYVRRSHLIMEYSISRFVIPPEIIHHINKIRNDDRVENLKLFANEGEHRKFHILNK